jgi:hypothetical protein
MVRMNLELLKFKFSKLEPGNFPRKYEAGYLRVLVIGICFGFPDSDFGFKN